MKCLSLFIFLIFPLSLFAQIDGNSNLPNILSYKGEELRILIKDHQSMLKISDEDIESIIKIVDDRKKEYFEIIDKMKKSIPRDVNGRPTGKADADLMLKIAATNSEVSTSIHEILGEKRYRRFRNILIEDIHKKNAELEKKTLEDRNGKK